MKRFLLLAGLGIGLAACVTAGSQSTVCNPGFFSFAFGTNATMLLGVGPQGCTGEFTLTGAITGSSIVKQASNGNAFISGASYGYTPNPGFSGRDSFVFSISGQGGGMSGTSQVTVNVTVSP